MARHEMIHPMGRNSGSLSIGPVLFGRDISACTGRGVVLVVIFKRTVWDLGGIFACFIKMPEYFDHLLE